VSTKSKLYMFSLEVSTSLFTLYVVSGHSRPKNLYIDCEANLERLQNERNMSTGILHTINLAIIQLAILNEGTSKAKQE
jgi:hypothetical protein